MKKACTTKAAQITVSLSPDDLEVLLENLLNILSCELPGTDERTPAEIVSAWKEYRPQYLARRSADQSKAERLNNRAANDREVALAEKLLAQLPGKPGATTEREAEIIKLAEPFVERGLLQHFRRQVSRWQKNRRHAKILPTLTASSRAA